MIPSGNAEMPNIKLWQFDKETGISNIFNGTKFQTYKTIPQGTCCKLRCHSKFLENILPYKDLYLTKFKFIQHDTLRKGGIIIINKYLCFILPWEKMYDFYYISNVKVMPFYVLRIFIRPLSVNEDLNTHQYINRDFYYYAYTILNRI